MVTVITTVMRHVTRHLSKPRDSLQYTWNLVYKKVGIAIRREKLGPTKECIQEQPGREKKGYEAIEYSHEEMQV